MVTLIILNKPSEKCLQCIYGINSRNTKTVYWSAGSVDKIGLLIWCQWADQIVIEDKIFQEVYDSYNELIHNKVYALSETVFGSIMRFKDLLKKPLRNSVIINTGERNKLGPVLFFISNDTIAKMLIPISSHLEFYVFVVPSKKTERAEDVLSRHNLPYLKNQPDILDRVKPSIVILGHDWSGEEKDLVQIAKKSKIITVCIQEGCLDWDDPVMRRMEWVDYPFVQGPLTLRYLRQRSYFITGNPRFDGIKLTPLPKSPRIMINCNFTYGEHEEARYSWIYDVVKACERLGLNFFISKHPRDNANLKDLPIIKSSAEIVQQQISMSSLLVTRFSTLVYEAMLVGRPVVYYNPHNEKMKTFNEDDTGGIYKTNNSDNLQLLIQSAMDNTGEDERLRKTFLNIHCGINDKRSAKRCAESIAGIIQTPIIET